jgi:hypothetical protein
MPYFGIVMLGLQIACAVHAGKTGRPFFWIYLIIFLPGIGMLAYAAVELVPEFFGSYRGQKAASAVGRMVNPGRNYRGLKDAVETAPTVENMLRLGEECIALGRYAEAVELCQHCLQGMYASDPVILAHLAEAQFGAGDAVAAKATLDRLRAANPQYRSDTTELLYARALEAGGDLAAARTAYEPLVGRYPGPEAKCRYALLLQKMGERERAAAIFAEVKKELDRAPRHMRRRYGEWHSMARANAGG